MSLLHAAILLPFIFAAAIPLAQRLVRRVHAGWFVLPVPVLLFVYFLSRLPEVQNGGQGISVLPWMPSLGVDFIVRLDGLSLLFALLISGIGSLVVLYSLFYLDKNKEAVHRFYVYLLMFMGAMLGVVLSDNLMVLYGFWELTSVSSFLLIAFWHRRERSLYGALKSMLITVFGGLALFSGFILLYVMTGTFSVSEIMGQAGLLADQSLLVPAMLLILIGAFTKSAQFPFHIWLPDAMEAPTPVSAYLHSATMVKAGIYLVARLSPLFAGLAGWFWLVTGFGLMTLIYASYRALKQTDLKAMLAFSTVSQLGLIMSLLGIGSAAAFYTGEEALFYTKATTAAIFHLINHAIFKGALFMVVGNVDHEAGTRDIRKLGGLMSLMPVTFTVALIGTFSMAGLPPFNGFLSKEMFFTGVLSVMELDVWNLQAWGALIPVVAWIASIFTFVYSMLLVFKTFTGKQKPEELEQKPHEAPLGMLIPPVVLGSLAVVFGLFPNLLSQSLIEPAVSAVHPAVLAAGESFHVHISFWHGWTMEIFMTIGVVLLGTVLYRLHGRARVLHQPLTERISINQVYDSGLKLLNKGALKVTRTYMTGSVRHYLLYIFSFMIAALVIAFYAADGISLNMEGYAPMPFYEAVVLLVLVLATLAVPFATSRVTSIILTGAVGYAVSLFFVVFRAPDLALTQIIVETVSVALFLLCFYHLPKLRRNRSSLKFRLPNLVISIGVGVIMTLIALAASGSRAFDSISDFFLAESYNLAGGRNVVNVILVDFRGFDTLLEIMVLGIASLAIFALARLSLDADADGLQSQNKRPGAGMYLARSNDVILRTAARTGVVYIVMTFALYLFFAGHHEPGGGFIGALMTSGGLVLMLMAFGMKTVNRLIPIDFKKLIATGLSVALLTGIGSFVFQVPFLTHAFGYFQLPLLGKTELATAVLFDLGVYLAVIGVTMNILYTIVRDE